MLHRFIDHIWEKKTTAFRWALHTYILLQKQPRDIVVKDITKKQSIYSYTYINQNVII